MGVVKVQMRTQFGSIRIYPVNEYARLFCSLLGVRTLSTEKLRAIERLGFSIEYVPQSVDLETKEET